MNEVKFGPPLARSWLKIERKGDCIEDVGFAGAVRAKYTSEVCERANNVWLAADPINVTTEGCEVADFDRDELKLEIKRLLLLLIVIHYLTSNLYLS